MLISHEDALATNSILSLMGKLNGNDFEPFEITQGIYMRPDFGSSSIMPGFNHCSDLQETPYGICDNYQQIITQHPEIHDEERSFVVILTPVRKEAQPSDGGWRWRKWGPYIGEQRQTCEYLYDEPDIDLVYVYHIYEKA
jgi:hypothetical protein